MAKCFIGWEESANAKGRCCCNCKFQRAVSAHPWNRNEAFKGSVTKLIGWGCTVPDMDSIILFEQEHSMCEMHIFKQGN